MSEHLSFPLFHRKRTFDELTIDIDELYLLTGYREHRPTGYALEAVNEVIAEMGKHSRPEYGFAIIPGKYDKDKIHIKDSVINTGRIIASALRESDYYAIFLATMGPDVDTYIKRLQEEGDMVKVFFADAIGSVLAEACAALMIEDLQKEASSYGLLISNSYSPGYCDWVLTDQKLLFGFFPEKFCDVKLTPSCLMLPVKSVSGIIGVGENVKKRPYGCQICKMTSCIKNKKNAV